MPSKPLSATIETPMSMDDPTDVAAEEIPLPPPEMWDELDNSGAATAAPPVTPAMADAEPEIAQLIFSSDTHQKAVPLKHPFEFNGDIVSEIIVRRLRIGEVDRILRRPKSTRLTMFDVYSEMTGYSSAVLRLPAVARLRGRRGRLPEYASLGGSRHVVG